LQEINILPVQMVGYVGGICGSQYGRERVQALWVRKGIVLGGLVPLRLNCLRDFHDSGLISTSIEMRSTSGSASKLYSLSPSINI